MSQAAASQPTRTRPGSVASVDPQPFLTWLADLIRAQQRVEIADVIVTDTWCVAVRYGDGAASYVKVCHTAPADAPTPERPSWPGPNAMPAKAAPRPDAADTSMRVLYFAGWLRHLIEHAEPRRVTAVEPFLTVGAVGPHWSGYGLKVTPTRGDALFLSIVGGAPDGGFDLTLPEHFDPADLPTSPRA